MITYVASGLSNEAADVATNGGLISELAFACAWRMRGAGEAVVH
jgi:hypothetical protein